MDKVKQRLIELVPEIAELKFGCRIRTRWNTDAVVLGFSKLKSTKSQRFYKYMHGMTASTIAEGAILEILGRQVTLADVLRAIQKVGGTLHEDAIVYETPHGQLLTRYWNLTTDYDGQTQEVKDFIGKLLGV